jgi:hypothetical protein
MGFMLPVTRDIKAYEAFYLDHLSKLPNVHPSTRPSVTVIKETTVLPLASGSRRRSCCNSLTRCR